MGEVPKKETVLVTKSKAGQGAALTQVTDAAEHVVITIPAGKGGILYAVSFSMTFVGTTILNAGGVATLRNSHAEWDPFYVPTGAWTVVTEGGDALPPFVFPCFKKLPGNSTVSINYIPFDNTISQYLEVTLHWIMTDADPEVETFVDVVHPLAADYVTTAGKREPIVTSWAHNANDRIPIPLGREGIAKAVILQSWNVATTIIRGGGLFEMFADNHDIGPCEVWTHMLSILDAGGEAYNPMIIPKHHEVKENSNYIGYFTPQDAQDQSCTFGLIWERPYRPKP
jgi:hypothetical protein